MTQLDRLHQEFHVLHQKTRQGDLFQSLGDLMADILSRAAPQAATTVALPDDGETVLEKIKAYSDDLEDSVPEENISIELLQQVVAQLANPLPQYRDTGAFFFLSYVIQNDMVSAEQLRWLTKYLISDEQLFAHILEPENDAVYQRAFSMLILSLLLFVQRTKAPFLGVKEVDEVIEQVALYAALERDTRGFIGTNGWAHAFTHISNAIAELFLMPQLMRADKLFLLASILAGYRELKQPLVMGETDRLVEIVIHLANQHQLYADYLLVTLKIWRKDIVTQQPKQTEAHWHQLYNRSRFFNAIILCDKEDVPSEIYRYVDQTKDYLV